MAEREIDQTFYASRALPEPVTEHWPQTGAELGELLAERDERDPPLLCVGAGLHLDPSALGERVFEVVRTEGCDRLLGLDRRSGIVRVEAGMRWRTLQEALAVDGFGLTHYALQCDEATVGGLLSRRHPMPRALFGGDVREGVVALQAMTPGEPYRYLPAPRKSSGPDMRYLFMGGQGALGVILDVSLVCWPLQGSSAWSIACPKLGEALEAWRWIMSQCVRVSWSHWSSESGRLIVATHLPSAVRKVQDRAAREHFATRLELVEGEQVEQLRVGLERQLPDRRLDAHAARTARAVLGLEALAKASARLDELAEAESSALIVTPFGDHSVTLYLRQPDEAALKAACAWLEPSALWVEPILGAGAQQWAPWSQQLKRQLDPHDTLAIGP